MDLKFTLRDRTNKSFQMFFVSNSFFHTNPAVLANIERHGKRKFLKTNATKLQTNQEKKTSKLVWMARVFYTFQLFVERDVS